jgi:hypothetical protein
LATWNLYKKRNPGGVEKTFPGSLDGGRPELLDNFFENKAGKKEKRGSCFFIGSQTEIMKKENVHLNIFDPKRREIFEILGFAENSFLYLAGGTALALQIGHRTSVDFDFYREKSFRKGEFFPKFRKALGKFKIKILRDFDDTFEIEIDGVHLSCFYYPYKLLRKPLESNHIKIASIEDIAAMKLVAVSQRGTKRDFFDMYYLLKRFSLEEIIEFTQKKFPEFDIYSGLRGLLFFKDADADKNQGRIRLFDRTLKWKTVKGKIQKEVFSYQNKFIR